MSAILKKTSGTGFQNFVNEGLRYHKRDQFQSALYYYFQALKLKPNDALLNNLLGILARKEEQYERAAYFFQRRYD